MDWRGLSSKLEDAIKANKMGIVTVASASEGARAQGLYAVS
jgi:hypothetical protein